MCEWTPPWETSPIRWTLVPRSKAAVSTGIVEERPVGDGVVHALEVLVETASRADREMADLRVPHLSGWKPDGLARRIESRVRKAGHELVEHGRPSEVDGVPRPGRGATPAVEDDERYEWVAAASQIAANDSTSREAPPTRAPSTAGSARSSAALSGFTDPP